MSERREKRRVAVALRIDLPYPQHQGVFLGVQRYVREHPPWNCVVDEHPGLKLRGRGELFQHYDGVIARASPAARQRLKRLGVPLVNTWYQHARQGVPGVYHDAERAFLLAAEHLIERGFRRVCLICNEDHRTARENAPVFAARCAERGVTCDLPRIPHALFDDADAWLEMEKRMMAWLDGLLPPVGICLQDPAMSRLLIAMCQGRGWDVPRDVAIISLNDNRTIAELDPRITCVDNNHEQVGYEAAALLDRLIDGEPPSEQPIMVPPKGVVARHSTDYYAVEDGLAAAALRYISGRLGEHLSVERIARALDVSSRNLQMRFQAALGRPISDEIRRLRLAAAERLLGDKELQIGEIAQRTGFGNSTVMSQVFRRELGMNPSTYRKQGAAWGQSLNSD